MPIAEKAALAEHLRVEPDRVAVATQLASNLKLKVSTSDSTVPWAATGAALNKRISNVTKVIRRMNNPLDNRARDITVPNPRTRELFRLGLTHRSWQNYAMISKIASLKTDLEDRLRFESVLAELSSRFVNLEPSQVDREIAEAARRICECLALDISSVWQLSPDEPDVLRMTHVYRRLDEPPLPEDFDPRVFNPWALGQVFSGKTVVLPSIGG